MCLKIEKNKVISFQNIFQNDHPVDLEIGVGKGSFIVNYAFKFKERNIVGIEIERKYAFYAADRIKRRKLKNAAMICGNAEEVVQENFGIDSISQCFIFFPDPWPKRRDTQKRVMKFATVETLHLVLKSDGIFNLATDVKDYFHRVQKMMEGSKHLFKLVSAKTVDQSNSVSHTPRTNYEKKYLEEGRPIYDLVYQKI